VLSEAASTESITDSLSWDTFNESGELKLQPPRRHCESISSISISYILSLNIRVRFPGLRFRVSC
jgi:hypothetical protein